MRGDAEGRHCDVELVEETKGLVDGVDDSVEVLLGLLGGVGGGS